MVQFLIVRVCSNNTTHTHIHTYIYVYNYGSQVYGVSKSLILTGSTREC